MTIRYNDNLPNFTHASEIVPFPQDYYMRRIQNNDPVTNPATPRYVQETKRENDSEF